MAAHFELYIGQGPLLEASRRKIGIVKGVQAYRWYTVEATGRACHTGTTDFGNRADPLLAAAKMVLQSHRLATAHAALALTGILNLKPGSTNTVLEAQIVVDFEKAAVGEGVGSLNESVTKGRPCSVKITTDSVSSAVWFHPDCIKAVTEAAVPALGLDSGELTQEMVSGAGHEG